MTTAFSNGLCVRQEGIAATRSYAAVAVGMLLFAMPLRGAPGAPSRSVRIGSAQVWQRYSRFDAGPLPASRYLHNLAIILRPRAPAELQAFLGALGDPDSPQYHHWLTPEQFAIRFGASPSAVTQVNAWLRSSGMTDVHAARGGLWINFSGTTSAVEALLHTRMRVVVAKDTPHYANQAAPSVPAAVAPFIAGVVGLNDLGPDPQTVHAGAARAGSTALGPPDLAGLYGLTGLYAQGFTGESIAVAILGRTAIPEDDVRAFRTKFHLPQADFQTVVVPNSSGTKASLDEEEATLDLEMASGAAPGAPLVYVWGSTLDAAAEWAIDNRIATILSESYAGCENAGDIFYQTLAMQAGAEGITWLGAAGDSGAAACDPAGSPAAQFGLHATAPAGTPGITAVGGTEIRSDAPDSVRALQADATHALLPSQTMETGWSSTAAVIAGGGGFSQVFGKPGYQSDFLPEMTSGRMLPDVSFAASPHDSPYSVIFHGQSELAGGTSLATPLFAGILAVVNQYLIAQNAIPSQGLGAINALLYRLNETSPAVFHDVVEGSNDVPCVAASPECTIGSLGYSTLIGYDLATGLGSLDATALAENWTNATFQPSTATLTASATDATAEEPLQIVARLTSGGVPLAGSPVQFYLTNAEWQPNQILLATVVSDSSGTAIYSADDLPTGSNVIEALATGTTSVSAAPPVSVILNIAGAPSTVQVETPEGAVSAGQSINLVVHVSIDGDGLQGPPDAAPCATNGSVSLYSADGSLQAGPVALNAKGDAALPVVALPSGTTAYSVTYSGNCYAAPSHSASFALSGTSVNSSDFVLNGPSTATLPSNHGGSFLLSIIPVDGFKQTVQITCTSSSPTASCTVPPNLNVSGITQVPVTVAFSSCNLQIAALGMFLLALSKRGQRFGVWVAVALLPVLVLTGCSGALIASQAQGPVAVTITAMSGSITHSVEVEVTRIP